MKNIPQCGRDEYIMNFTHRMRNLIVGMTWHAAFFLGMLPPGKKKEKYGFNSLESPNVDVPQLDDFKSGMADLVASITFKKHTNELQRNMREEISEMDRSND